MNRPASLRYLRPVLGWATGLSLGFVALMGVAHTKPGRPLLTLMFGSHDAKGAGPTSGCPLGFDKTAQDPAAKAASLKHQADRLRGEGKASARPALGFDLGQATRADVEAWAARQGVPCVKPAAPLFGADLSCADVAADRLPENSNTLGAKSLWFQFDQADRLVMVRATRYSPDSQIVAAALGHDVERLGREAGAPVRQQGEASAHYLEAGLLRQARVEFAFHDYYAAATATKIRADEYMLTEEYRSLPD
jgi:hypothetical protein